jgi:predicted hotdog family 3-hydroxylacyl-ACP dehydratase
VSGLVLDPGRWLAQTGPARLVAAVLEVREDGIECEGRVPSGHALAADGSAPAYLGLELAAQAAAILEATRHGASSGPRRGLLVSLRDVRIARPRLPVDQALRASVRAAGGAGGLVLYAVRVTHQGELDVEGTIGAYMAPVEGRGDGA